MENLSTAKKQLKCKKQLQGNDVTAARAGCQHTGTRKILSIVNLSFWAKYPIWKNEKQKKKPKTIPPKTTKKTIWICCQILLSLKPQWQFSGRSWLQTWHFVLIYFVQNWPTVSGWVRIKGWIFHCFPSPKTQAAKLCKAVLQFFSLLTGRAPENLVLLILSVTYGNVGDEKTDIILIQQVADISITITFKMEFHCQKVPAASNYFYFASCLRTHSPNFLFYVVMHSYFELKTSGGEVSYLFPGDPSPSEGNGEQIPFLES